MAINFLLDEKIFSPRRNFIFSWEKINRDRDENIHLLREQLEHHFTPKAKSHPFAEMASNISDSPGDS